IPQGLADGPYVHVMAMHHEEGIRIATLGETRATNDKVTALATRMRSNRQKELGELKQFMTTVAEDMAPADRSALKRMPVENLEKASGAAFDRMFLDTMVEHHQDTLAMTRTAKLVMPGVQQFAARLTQALAAEIKEAEALRKEPRSSGLARR
ncbi:MAG TPA: DUF305 domain-containing protein, partial [Vicinamibacterales bacterium]